MKAFIEDYGRFVVVGILFLIVVVGVIGGITGGWFTSVGSVIDTNSIVVATEIKGYPVINSPDVLSYVKRGEPPIDFSTWDFEAYEDSSTSTLIPVEVMGEDAIDYNTCGFYNIELVARNSQNKVFSKTVLIIVRDY